jgi:hypothetical protein
VNQKRARRFKVVGDLTEAPVNDFIYLGMGLAIKRIQSRQSEAHMTFRLKIVSTEAHS